MGFPGSSDSRESACNAKDSGWIPWSGKCLGEGNGYPLQCFCLENPVDREAWQAKSTGSKESDKAEWLTLSLFPFMLIVKRNNYNGSHCAVYKWYPHTLT